MILSSRVVKADRQSWSGMPFRLETERLSAAEVAQAMPDVAQSVQSLIDRAKQEAAAILEEAEMKSASWRKEAEEEGYRRGMERGRADGLAEAKAQWEDVYRRLAEPLEMVPRLLERIELLCEENTWAAASALVGRLFPVLAEREPAALVSYLSDLCGQVTGSDVTLYVDPEWAMRIAPLIGDFPESLKTVKLAVDKSLEAGQMRAEGDRDGVLGGAVTSLKAIMNEVLYEARREAG